VLASIAETPQLDVVRVLAKELAGPNGFFDQREFWLDAGRYFVPVRNPWGRVHVTSFSFPRKKLLV
jgi:hypothetical protein